MRVFVAMPHNQRQVDFSASTAFYHPIFKDSELKVSMNDAGGPEVLCNHNVLWAMAIDAYEAGEIDAFALIHADVGAEPGWLDILYREMKAYGADAISAVVPIKDDRGLTSTAVDDTGDSWLWRRLTLKQIAKMPDTFGDAELGAPIALNTGLMLVKFGPWCLEMNVDNTYRHLFRFEHAIRKESNGKRRVLFRPDDWLLSRSFRSAGLKLAATKAVKLNHCGGDFQWANHGDALQIGWEEDIQNGPNAPWRLALEKGFELDKPLNGTKAKLPNGEVNVIAHVRHDQDGVSLVFQDGTEARLNDCVAA